MSKILAIWPKWSFETLEIVKISKMTKISILFELNLINPIFQPGRLMLLILNLRIFRYKNNKFYSSAREVGICIAFFEKKF